MEKSEALEVGFKVVSLYAFLQGISALSLPISMHENTVAFRALQDKMGSVSGTFFAAAFLPSASLFSFGILLWLNSKRTKVSSTEPAQELLAEHANSLSPQMLQSIIFSALGILIVVESVAPIVNSISALSVFLQNLHDNRVIMSPFPYYRLIEGLVKLFFGCWLIIGSKGLNRFKYWLLTVGRKHW